jgi:hypothetical protein
MAESALQVAPCLGFLLPCSSALHFGGLPAGGNCITWCTVHDMLRYV